MQYVNRIYAISLSLTEASLVSKVSILLIRNLSTIHKPDKSLISIKHWKQPP